MRETVRCTVDFTRWLQTDGIGLLRCARCRGLVDVCDGFIGTVARSSEGGLSVFLCGECRSDDETPDWMTRLLHAAG